MINTAQIKLHGWKKENQCIVDVNHAESNTGKVLIAKLAQLY